MSDCHFTIDAKLVPHLKSTVRGLLRSRKAMPLLREMSSWIRRATDEEISEYLSPYKLNRSHISLPDKSAADSWLLMSQPNFSRWINNDAFSLGNRYINSIYFFIIVHYKDEIEAEQNQEIMKSSEPFVRSLRRIFNHDDDWKADLTKNFVGVYRLYRPFFLDPSFVLVGELRIGTRTVDQSHASPFDATLSYSYRDRSGRERNELHTGKVAKHGSSISIFLGNQREDQDKAHFIFYADRHEGRPADTISGVLIANANSSQKDLASTWPFHAVRLNLADPREMPKDGVIPFADVHRNVAEELARGAAHLYPNYPGIKSKP